ncbi:LUD domain-containing protein [Flavobacterium cellulosilyticum]|uniref:Lactate utilization protein B/C n=1 Tax=Flavobacterium cellulosilyticum TaxID=2541731 RepID=A0A4R5C8Y0_9FLAO|nr:lactate utilization protein B/C [Flavobacterium cellulosilyticum]TDD95249.1 lactate utilization protein B/C [Flavobacterium cellulosilyticum]
MSLFRKFFGSINPASDEEKENENSKFYPDIDAPLDELFIYNFKKNGGKFLYCENAAEVKDQLENILEENDWFESEALCFEPNLYQMLDDNKITHDKPKTPAFFLGSCENLIAEEGSILFSSKQIKQQKPNELPANIVIIATTSQIIGSKSDGLSVIKKKYVKDYPTNITAMKYFEKVEEEDFTQYGSTAKNLYLLLLEDQ